MRSRKNREKGANFFTVKEHGLTPVLFLIYRISTNLLLFKIFESVRFLFCMAMPQKSGIAMSSQLLDGLVKELNEKIGDRAFFTLPELVSLGLFGTVQTARQALKEGELPFIRISERRCVIPRAALINYIRAKLANKHEVAQ